MRRRRVSVSVVAVCIALAAFAVALLELVRSYEWSRRASVRLVEHEERLDRQRDSKDALAERVLNLKGRMDSTDAWVEAMTGAQVDRNIEMDALRDRIDALSARMDAVELACGIREKPKIMGGAE